MENEKILAEIERLKVEKLKALEKEQRERECLPHIFGFKLFAYQEEYLDTTNNTQLLCACNQIGKSTAQQLKCVRLATNTNGAWEKFFPVNEPRVFWYLYPDLGTATREFEEKWVKDILPRAEYKDHPQYGWKANYKQKEIYSLEFHSGVTVYFHSYEKKASSLQAATVDHMFTDEELPFGLLGELSQRISYRLPYSYFSMVFTATLGQEEWRRAIEEIGEELEMFPEAWKKQVGKWDCLKYADGTPSHITPELIKKQESLLGSQDEIDLRINGKFRKLDGLKFPSFSPSRDVRKPFPVHQNNFPNIYGGVDLGSGGKEGHPSVITFVAVNNRYTKGVVFRVWTSSKVEKTTNSDVAVELGKLRTTLHAHVIETNYDHQAVDFNTYCDRLAIPVSKANKSQEKGTDIVNSLFKNGMLFILDLEETKPLQSELRSLLKTTNKRNAVDDHCDSLRYTVATIPWNWEGALKEQFEKVAEPKTPEIPLNKRGRLTNEEYIQRTNHLEDQESDLAEFEYWGAFYE